MMSPRMYRLRMNRTTPHKYPTNFRNSNFKRRKTRSDTVDGSCGGGLGAVSFCIIVSAITVGSLFWFGGYREMASVLIAFIGSLAVEVVGIAIVIAKYLFPNGGPTHPGQDNSNQQLAK